MNNNEMQKHIFSLNQEGEIEYLIGIFNELRAI